MSDRKVKIIMGWWLAVCGCIVLATLSWSWSQVIGKNSGKEVLAAGVGLPTLPNSPTEYDYFEYYESASKRLKAWREESVAKAASPEAVAKVNKEYARQVKELEKIHKLAFPDRPPLSQARQRFYEAEKEKVEKWLDANPGSNDEYWRRIRAIEKSRRVEAGIPLNDVLKN